MINVEESDIDSSSSPMLTSRALLREFHETLRSV